MNIRAAFLHNVSDALASVGVIFAGSLIPLYQWYWSDTLITLIIAFYVLYQPVLTVNYGTPLNNSILSVERQRSHIASIGNVTVYKQMDT
ncbi:MAG: cation transporter [Woeseiaceae bacterium]